nr:hypothetical protein CFP56_16753 [Quercus suber]
MSSSAIPSITTTSPSGCLHHLTDQDIDWLVHLPRTFHPRQLPRSTSYLSPPSSKHLRRARHGAVKYPDLAREQGDAAFANEAQREADVLRGSGKVMRAGKFEKIMSGPLKGCTMMLRRKKDATPKAEEQGDREGGGGGVAWAKAAQGVMLPLLLCFVKEKDEFRRRLIFGGLYQLNDMYIELFSGHANLCSQLEISWLEIREDMVGIVLPLDFE